MFEVKNKEKNIHQNQKEKHISNKNTTHIFNSHLFEKKDSTDKNFSELFENDAVFLPPDLENNERVFLHDISFAASVDNKQIFKDYFFLESDVLPNTNLRSIVLPKFLLSSTKVISEQSLLLLTYNASHSNPSIFKALLKATKSGIKKFLLHFKEKEDGKNISTWSFHNAKIHAMDFGYVAVERTEPHVVSVEISYEYLSIDGFEF